VFATETLGFTHGFFLQALHQRLRWLLLWVACRVAMLFAPTSTALIHDLGHVATILQHVAVGLTASLELGHGFAGVHGFFVLVHCASNHLFVLL
jgi:hypothetical protein